MPAEPDQVRERAAFRMNLLERERRLQTGRRFL